MTRAPTDVLLDTLRLGEAPDESLTARWRAADVHDLAGLITYEHAAIWLFRRLRALQLLDAVPAQLIERLRALAFEASALRLQVEVEAAAVTSRLQDAGVEVILIKGVARCALAHRYPYLDARGTSDVDLLVQHPALAHADSLLRADGFAPALTDESHAPHHHLPPLTRGNVCVELHDSTSVRVPPEVAWARARNEAEAVDWNGRSVLVPPATSLAWDAIAHALEDEAAGFRLHRFLEVAALVAGGAPIDWDLIRTRSATGEACNPSVHTDNATTLAQRWLAGALALVTPSARPPGYDVAALDLAALLDWRQRVLRLRSRLGRAATERLLQEGTRAMAGLPIERSLPATPWPVRARRNVAGRWSRLGFGIWRQLRAR